MPVSGGSLLPEAAALRLTRGLGHLPLRRARRGHDRLARFDPACAHPRGVLALAPVDIPGRQSA